jgi:hypothetical protein
MSVRPAGGIAAAIVTIVALPVVINQAVQPPEKPAPKKGALTIQLSEAETLGDSAARLRIKATGPAPEAPTDLLNGEGTEVVSVETVGPTAGSDGAKAETKCQRSALPVRQAVGSGANTEWCLELGNIGDGSQVSGEVAGKETVLTLTVSRRAPFFCGAPFWVSVGGLLLGFLVLAIPLWLRRKIRMGLLDKAVSDNASKGPGEKIEGLADWVKGRRLAGQSDDALLPLVDRAIATGPLIARDGRAKLRRHLNDSVLAEDHSYRVKATELLREKEELDVGDFLSGTGEWIDAYPTDAWVEGLERLEQQRTELGTLRARVDAMDAGDDRDKVEAALESAEQSFNAISGPKAVDGFDAKLEAVQASFPVRLAVEVALLGAAPMSRAPGRRWLAAARGDAIERLEQPVVAVPTESRPAPDKLFLYKCGTVVLVALVVVFALVNLKENVYEPVVDFGDFKDYFTLVSTAIAAGVSSTVVALLAPWNPREPSED